MTPQRERYLAKCSKKEKILRKLIASAKESIRIFKKESRTYSCGKEWTKEQLYYHKCLLTAYRYELAKLKKRVRKKAYPVRSFIEEYEDINLVQYEIWKCPDCDTIVGGDLEMTCKFCPICGNHIIWKKE